MLYHACNRNEDMGYAKSVYLNKNYGKLKFVLPCRLWFQASFSPPFYLSRPFFCLSLFFSIPASRFSLFSILPFSFLFPFPSFPSSIILYLLFHKLLKCHCINLTISSSFFLGFWLLESWAWDTNILLGRLLLTL
jgi:hypothetical protein